MATIKIVIKILVELLLGTSKDGLIHHRFA